MASRCGERVMTGLVREEENNYCLGTRLKIRSIHLSVLILRLKAKTEAETHPHTQYPTTYPFPPKNRSSPACQNGVIFIFFLKKILFSVSLNLHQKK